MEERRRYSRLSISFSVEYRLLPTPRYFYTVSKNLSPVGVKIVTNGFIPKNELIKLSLNMVDKIVNLKARVVWCSQDRSPEHYSAGMEFLEVGAPMRDELSRFMAETRS